AEDVPEDRQVAEARYAARVAAEVRLHQAADRQGLTLAHLDRRGDGAGVQTGHEASARGPALAAVEVRTDRLAARADRGVQGHPDAVLVHNGRGEVQLDAERHESHALQARGRGTRHDRHWEFAADLEVRRLAVEGDQVRLGQ